MPSEQAMTFFLGIDGGNSKTLAMVATDTGEVLAAGRAASGSHQTVGLERAISEIGLAADEALSKAGLARDDITAVFYSLAGADLQVDYDVLRPAISGEPLAPIWDLDNDVIAALRSGTDNANAVTVVLGSGTNAYGRNDRGQEIRLAGLGWVSGDWGGGGDLAREAIRLGVRMWDGRGEQTLLHDMILRALDLPDMGALIEHLHTHAIRRPKFLRVAELVFEAAERGDGVATELAVRSGQEVAITASTLLRRLNLTEKEPDVVLAGSIFKSGSAPMLDSARQEITRTSPRARIIIPDIEPAAGAVICALELAGVEVDACVLDAIERTAPVAARDAMIGAPA